MKLTQPLQTAGEKHNIAVEKGRAFLLSLKDIVETGKGRPSPDDVKIDHWN